MINYLAVFIGGGLGSALRYAANSFLGNYAHLNLPYATFLVNALGSFILGFLFIFFMHKTDLSHTARVALTVGFCGGLTTFSTFSFEVFNYFEQGQILLALGYILLSVTVCVLMVALGIAAGTCLLK